MNHPNYGRIFAAWREECSDVWREYMHHDFVEGLGNGSLARAAFLNYLQQDYVFLIHFARAWSLAVVKAGNLAEMQLASAIVHQLLHEEMALHRGICEAEGISLEALENTQEAPENMAYTRYVLEAGFSGDFLDLLAALAPCVMGYGEIGARLKAEASETPYRDWIETYGGEDSQKLCRDVGAFLDQAVIDRLGPEPESSPRWKSLTEKFRNATRLEVGFWGLGRA